MKALLESTWSAKLMHKLPNLNQVAYHHGNAILYTFAHTPQAARWRENDVLVHHRSLTQALDFDFVAAPLAHFLFGIVGKVQVSTISNSHFPVRKVARNHCNDPYVTHV